MSDQAIAPHEPVLTPFVQLYMAGPPRGKPTPRSTWNQAQHFKDQRSPGAVFEKQLRYAAQQAMNGRAPTDRPVVIDVIADFEVPKSSFDAWEQDAAIAGHFFVSKKPDYDNLLKQLDALTGVVWDDDKRVVEARVRKRWGAHPSMTIEVFIVEPSTLQKPVKSRKRQAEAAADLFPADA